MVAAEFSYAPGTGMVIAMDSVAMLLADNTDEGLVERLWASVRDGATFDRLAEVLADHGLRRLPSLGLAVMSDDGMRLLVRGAVTARVGAGPAGLLIGAEAAVTWQERSIPGAVEVVLSAAADATPRLPLVGGVVAASAVRLSAASAATSRRRPPAALPIEAPAEQRYDLLVEVPGFPDPDGEPIEDVAPVPELDPEAGPFGPPSGIEAPMHTMVPPEPDDVAPADPALEPLAIEAPMHTMVAPEPDDDYDHMFGATRHVSVESAAVRPVDPVDEEPPAAADSGAARIPAPVPPPPVQAPGEVLPMFGSGLIDAVPGGFTAMHESAAKAVGGPAPAGDHDGMTMSRGQLLRLQGATAVAASAPADPHQVLAVSCPHGHLNPPHAQRCRMCQEAIALQAPKAVLRPSLGWLRFSNGIEVTLDRPVIIGRQPSAERVAAGGDLPQLVTLASPSQDISRRHVEVQLEGWHVLVRDLGSTNGTIVTLPGRDPERLHSGESLPIVPGTVVSVADETTFSYEVSR